MFSETIIQQLKQSNISVDGEKTKERAKELWQGTTSEEKKNVEELAGIARGTIYRIFSTGSISAKSAIAFAQTLNISPYYLIGESHDRGECTDELLKEFLIRFGYEKLLSQPVDIPDEINVEPEQPPQPENTLITPQEVDGNENETQSISAKEEVVPEPELPDEGGFISTNNEKMNEDDMILLMRSIMLREKFGGKNAAELATKLRTILIS